MASEWPLRQLHEVADEVTVGFVGTMADQYVESGVLFLRSLNIRPFELDLSDTKFVSKDFHKKIRKSALAAGDVVIVRTGRPGTCAVVPQGLGDVNCSDLVIVRCSENLRPHFFCYWVNAMAGDHVSAYSVGAVQQHFNVSSAKLIQLPVPPLADQDRALGVLRAMDDRIQLLKTANTTLEAIAQALFKSWFVDFDPVRAKAEGREPEGMDAATAALFPSEFEESEPGLIPAGWRGGTLGDIGALNAESWSTKRQPDRIVYVDLSSVGRNQFADLEEHEFSDAPSRARRVLRDGDSIIGTVRPGNRAFAYIHQPCSNLTGSTGFAVLSPRIKEASGFIYLAATRDESIGRLANLADGGAYPAVRPDVVSATPVIIPSDAVLATFGAIANPLLVKIAENNGTARVLANLRDTLLPRLISGKLRLPEAEAAVAEAVA